MVTAFLLGLFLAEPASALLRDGDRVVLVGDTLIEREQSYGHLETEILRLAPDVRLTFRNLGWSADTPAGRSRCYFDPPSVGFQRLVEQIKACDPTLLVVGYGMGHALEVGDPAAFASELNQLLDQCSPKTRLLLLSPIRPVASADGPPVEPLVERLREYARTIERIANERGAPFVNLFATSFPDGSFDPNGIVYSERGYEALAHFLAERMLGLSEKEVARAPVIDLAQVKVGKGTAAELLAREKKVTFDAAPDRLPSARNQAPRLLGLTGGPVEIEVGGVQLSYNSAGESTTPVAGGWNEQSEELRSLVTQKDSLYFQRYRPQNITYLLGFRAHEQGQNAKEISQLDPKIADLERQIDALRRPKPLTCTLQSKN